ncbi:hypothetical protein NECAME_08021 [Necator americanus]|uniref:Uncharacterized protein n=1 Tax=Necator americanus TaxID=51031 RepID=W2TML0_NECAM|nr:hypothetical protein NECAME_08021 [Necator americanus]ETN82371.1 hypothetical protein NECAME_08021 [Necator americanus]
MLRLTRELKHQSISKRDDSSEEDEFRVERRRSARLNPKQEQEAFRDSGTESDEDELEEIAKKSLTAKNMEAFLSGSPPALSSSPPTTSDIDTESWDSFGHESGILTGDGDSTSGDDECPTPRPRRRMRGGAFSNVKFSKEQCEFPLINVCGTGEKRRYSMTERNDTGPISSRLRSNNDSPREIIVAARRAPVRLLINKPYSCGTGDATPIGVASSSTIEASCSAPKRNRCNNWRPYLDLEKMIKNRISSESPRTLINKKD